MSDKDLKFTTAGEYVASSSFTYTTEVEEDENGEQILNFPPEMLTDLGWEPGDVLVWSDNGDGTYTLTKKES